MVFKTEMKQLEHKRMRDGDEDCIFTLCDFKFSDIDYKWCSNKL